MRGKLSLSTMLPTHEMKLDANVLDETFTLQLELIFFRAYSCLLEYKYHAVLCYSCMSLSNYREISHGLTGLDVATCGVTIVTSFYSVATKLSRLVANLAPKIGDFLLWENVHQ